MSVLGLDSLKLFLLFGLVFFCVLLAHSENGITSRLNIEEVDGSPSVWPYKLKVSTGTLTDNGDGTATLVTGGGSGGSGTPAGVNGNIQYNNGGSFGGASFFNINTSSSSTTADTEWKSSSIGPVLTDSDNCRWRTTVTTAGNLTTTLIGCPTVVASNSRPCSRGQSLGLLLSITCSETLP